MKQKQDERLGTEKLGKLILSMALPAVAAQLINVLYNIVDRIYIGHIAGEGQLALTGVGVTFPIIIVISAFASFAGMGGAPVASMALGKKEYKRAEKILGNCASLLFVFSVVLPVLFMVFKTPILYAFGASDSIIKYASDYITIYLCGTIFVQFALGLNTFISAQGNAKTAMLSVLIGAVINIILDPIFIFGLGLGVRGAAIATIISQAASAIWVVHFLLSEKSVIRIRKENLKFDKKIVLQIAAIGVSPFVMQSTESLVGITMNSGLQNYGGDIYVGTMSILTSVMQLIIIPVQGVSIGIQPILSYNFGAGKYDRVMGAFKRMIAICMTVTFVMSGIAMLAPGVFVTMFTSETALLEMTKKVMPIYFFGVTIFGAQMACQSMFQALGMAKTSVFVALLRKVILLIPLAIILPKFAGVMGIYYAEPIADIIAVVTTVTVFLLSYKKVLRNAGKDGIINKNTN